ncbi:MAG TPA: phytanoyl-CoA dioxygenase family protein [Candidatus Saccharimonadales bacterium]|nr:phytanoyl-CoA dioxygenase family protein [Candidatus Saccharimonadales bacterium]
MSASTIITNETRELVTRIEETAAYDAARADVYTQQLVGHLTLRCSQPEVQAKYAGYGLLGEGLDVYPLTSDGFAQSFDVLSQEDDMFEHWGRFGVVVGRSVAPQTLCVRAIDRVKSVVQELSGGVCDIDNPETYGSLPVDSQRVPILTRGFFEIYHDDSLAQLRQSLRAYLHHVVLWGRADLWTTFDRFGVKLPGHHESAALPLHVDQNPKEHPDFRTVQGVLALADCPVERGTLRAVPGSKSYFTDYLPMAPYRGEYVELDTKSPIGELLTDHAQPIPLRQGDLVSWDSRTTHANTANTSSSTRFVALVAAGVARENDQAAVAARSEAFASGLGSNVRHALMHASKRPRYTDQAAIAAVRQPERLTGLGKLLYGQERYDSL